MIGSVTVNVVVPRGLARRVDAKLVQQVAERALALDGWQQPATLDVLIVREDEMRQINASRCGVDAPTDVLSFPMVELRPGEGLTSDFFVLPPEATLHLGDVVVSIDSVESHAVEAGHSKQRELAYLTVHGVLHILGYDHDVLERRRRMRRREEEVLAELGLRRNGTQVKAAGRRRNAPPPQPSPARGEGYPPGWNAPQGTSLELMQDVEG